MSQSGFAKMNLVVDHAWHQMQPGAIDDLIGLHIFASVDVQDFVVLNQDVSGTNRSGQDNVGVSKKNTWHRGYEDGLLARFLLRSCG